MSINKIKNHIYITALLFVLIFVLLYKEQIFYAYYQHTSPECIQVGKACLSLKKGWHKDYFQELVAIIKNNETYNSVDDAASMSYMPSIYKPMIFSSERPRNLFLIYEDNISDVMKSAETLESETVYYGWGEAIITPASLLGTNWDRIIIPKYNLILFSADHNVLNDVNWIN